MSNRIGGAVFMALLCLNGGCRSFDSDQVRSEQARLIPQESLETTEALLARFDGPLTLADCVGLALEESLEVETAELQRRLARLQQRASFSDFLPNVTLGLKKTYWDPMPMIKFGSTGIAMHDKSAREVTWNIQWSILNPATWFLYDMYSRGYEVAELALDYTRQSLIFQVTTLYYQTLELDQMREVSRANLQAARARVQELTAHQQEGLVPAWQVDQGQAMVLARQVECHGLERSLRESQADLLMLMGMSPQAEIPLALDLPLEVTDRDLADLITQALLNHPSLIIADRQVEIAREKVKYAVAAFLPQLMGFAARHDTTDSHQVFSNTWNAGFSGTLTVFNGFANIQQYQGAKVLREQAFIEREQATLALMVQVLRAYDQSQTAREQLALAAAIRQAADGQLRETQQQHEQGLVTASDLLRQTATADQARIQWVQARFQQQVCMALLNAVLGHVPASYEEFIHEN